MKCRKKRKQIYYLKNWETRFYLFLYAICRFTDYIDVAFAFGGLPRGQAVIPRKNPEIGILNRSKFSLSSKDSPKDSPKKFPFRNRHIGLRVNVTIDFSSFLHSVRRTISRDSILHLANRARPKVVMIRSHVPHPHLRLCIANWFRLIGLARSERSYLGKWCRSM